MHFARSLLERRGSLALALGCVTFAGLVNCSSSDDVPPDVAVDGGDQPDANGTGDAATDAPVDRYEAPFDGGPLPVVCEAQPCATALVTTRGANASDRGEGFCALLHDGTVACWGANGAGQLGRGEEASVVDSANAARVPGVTGVVSLDHTCALDQAGDTYCWGTGPFLRSPTVATTTERTPVKLDIPKATKVAIGSSAGCAVSEGRVLCWGANTNAQIAPFHEQSPFAVLPPTEVALPAGEPIAQLVMGDATFALRTDGTMFTWGANPPLARLTSLFPDPYPAESVLRGASTLDVAENNACATVGGIGFCWGTVILRETEPAQSTSRLDRAIPARVAKTDEPLVQISTTRTVVSTTTIPPLVQPQRWCAVGASGAVYCWGYNAGGEVGDGTTDHAYEPVKVEGLPGPAAQVRTTPGATCALLTSGKIHCWGTNYYGQLGSGTLRIPSLTPQEVALP